jgi:hypothetical protein
VRYLSLFFFLIFVSIQAQNVKYVDENMNIIDSLTLTKKCKQHIFKCLKYDTDTLIIKKVLYKYKFGKLNDSTFQKIKKNLNTDSLSKSNIIVRYYDSLIPYKTLLKNHSKHTEKREKIYFDTSKTRYYYRSGHKFNKKIYERNRKNFIKTQNKCTKKYENKFDAKVFHVYKHDSNISKEYDNFDWTADNGIFQNTFFNIIFNYWIVIIKPDGEYFLIGSHISDKNLSKLLTTSDWAIFKEEWDKTLEKYTMNGIGVFKSESDRIHKKHCF